MSEEEGRTHKNGGYSGDEDRMDTLNRFRSATSISMSPELFEKLYLSPQNKIKGELRKTFGNPTPMCVRVSPAHTSLSSQTLTSPRAAAWPASCSR